VINCESFYKNVCNIDNTLLNKFGIIKRSNINIILGNKLFELIEEAINEDLYSDVHDELNIELTIW
jgi:hypothetical protein